MRTFLFTLHILTCVSLIIVVLIQRGKGANMGAMLGGGGSQTVFGARGAGNFLTKLTTGLSTVCASMGCDPSELCVVLAGDFARRPLACELANCRSGWRLAAPAAVALAMGLQHSIRTQFEWAYQL